MALTWGLPIVLSAKHLSPARTAILAASVGKFLELELTAIFSGGTVFVENEKSKRRGSR
jgi:hypothetical protein